MLGAASKGARRTDTASDRISARVEFDPNSGCWLWTACVNRHGYGLTTFQGRPYLAHRLSYEAAAGKSALGVIVRHKCDTPACVNPDHLLAGTHIENMADMRQRSRGRGKGKLTDALVRQARAVHAQGGDLGVIAKACGATRHTVWKAATGRTWGRVQ